MAVKKFQPGPVTRVRYNTIAAGDTGPAGPPGASLGTITGSGFVHVTGGAIDAAASHGAAGQMIFSNGTDVLWEAPAGDVSLTGNTFTVTALQGTPVDAGGTEGQFLVRGAAHWTATSLSGDVSASITTPGQTTVTAIQGRPITTNAPATNNVLLWTGSAWNPGAITSGMLPNLGGDVTGAPNANTVGKVQNQAVAAGTTNGQVWQYNGTSWAVVAGSSLFTPGGDLSGTATSQEVIGILSHALPALPTSAGNYALVYAEGTTSYSWTNTTSFGSTVTWANDLAGSTNTNQYVAAISGSAGGGGTVNLGATVNLTAAAGAGGLSLGSWTGATTLPTGNLSWAGAAAKTLSLVGASTFTLTGGASSTWSLSSGTLTVDAPILNLGTSACTQVQIGNSSNTNIITLVTKAVNDPVEIDIGGTFTFNSGNGSGDYLWLGAQGSHAAVQYLPTGMVFQYGVTSPTIQQATQSSSNITQNLTLQPQFQAGIDEGSAAANTPGSLVVNLGVPYTIAHAGSEAALIIGRNGVGNAMVATGPYPGSPTYGVIWLGADAAIRGTGAWAIRYSGSSGSLAVGFGASNIALYADTLPGSPATYSLGNAGNYWLNVQTTLVTFPAAVSSPEIIQTTQVNGGPAPQNLTIQPQWQIGTDQGSAALNTPGSLIVNLGAPYTTTHAGSEAFLITNRNGVQSTAMGAYSSAYGGWWGTVSGGPTVINWAIISNGTVTQFNAVSALYFDISGSTVAQLVSTAFAPYTSGGLTLGGSSNLWGSTYVGGNLSSGPPGYFSFIPNGGSSSSTAKAIKEWTSNSYDASDLNLHTFGNFTVASGFGISVISTCTVRVKTAFTGGTNGYWGTQYVTYGARYQGRFWCNGSGTITQIGWSAVWWDGTIGPSSGTQRLTSSVSLSANTITVNWTPIADSGAANGTLAYFVENQFYYT